MGVSCSKDTKSAVCGGAGSSTSRPLPAMATAIAKDESSEDFLPFSQLNDDVILCILSYVSYAPFERDVLGTLTLAAIEPGVPPPRDEEIHHLVEDYNAGATKLNKKLFKRKSNISPFRAPQEFYQEAFHGFGRNKEALTRLSSFHMFGTLTHVLPLVDKRLYKLCHNSDVLWIEALERLMGLKRSSEERSDVGSSDLWEVGVRHFVAGNNNSEGAEAASPTDSRVNCLEDDFRSAHDEDRHQLLPKACDFVSQEWQGSGSVAKEVFRQVLLCHKPVRLPLFSMFCPTAIGEELSIRLYEPRYRLMIHEIMMGRSHRERNGFPLATPRPRFLFGCKGDNTWRRSVACIVEVRRCLIHSNGIADVAIVPISWEILSDIVRRPESGGLMDGTVLQSPKRTRLPAFCMRMHLVLDQPIRIRLFEERYKALISEVMAGRSDEERNGSPVSSPRPQFVFVCNNRFRDGSISCLVDVERCRIHDDGSAQVTVVPTSWVLVESVRKRPMSGNLYDASVLHGLSSMSQG